MSTRERFWLIELLIVVAILLIIATMTARPLDWDKRQHVQETVAIKSITTIHAAQAQYQSQYGRFAGALAELGPPATGVPSVSGAGLIGSDLARGDKAGFRYIVQATESGYTVNANPIAFGSTGRHTYYSDETLILRNNSTAEPATAASPEFNAR